MSLIIWYSLGLLLMTAFGDCEIFDNCGYRLKLESGKRLYVVSPDYPYHYPRSARCLWNITSDTRIRLTCEKFDIPYSPNECERDVFEVDPSPSLPNHRFCGRHDIFSVESDGKEMIMGLRTVSNSPGGSFNCYAEATEDKRSCKCGSRNSVAPRIVDGSETGVNEYPMMAALINTQTRYLWCGATIISNKHVLTAAHCLISLDINFAGISVGDHDLNTGAETSAARLFKVARYDIHPSFERTKAIEYDIAVVTIDGTIDFSNEVSPVCLPFRHKNDDFEDSSLDVLGWSSTYFAGLPSNALLKTSLKVQNLRLCKAQYPDEDINYRHLCTSTAGRNICGFSSGGPVLWQNPGTERLVLLGINRIKACGSDAPSVNTRVGPYIDWIVSVTPGVQYCQAE